MSREHLDRACKNAALKAQKRDSEGLPKTVQVKLDNEIVHIDQVIKNIVLKTRKSKYNPSKGTNWCNLPIEMRLECMKWMNHRTRTRLSAASTTEKSLVASLKYKFDQVRVKLDIVPQEWTLEPYSEDINWQIECNHGGTEAFISTIFGKNEIDNFRIEGEEIGYFFYRRPFPMNLCKFAPFRFKRLSLFRNSNIHFFLKYSANLEKVDFCGNYSGCSFNQLFNLPATLKVKEYRFSKVHVAHFLDFLIGLVQKWIDMDAEVGKSIQFVVKTGVTMDVFAGKFADRIIEKSDEEVKIRLTDKQVLLRKVGSRVEDVEIGYFSCKVIPIDMPKSEYGLGDGWIEAVYEKSLKKDGTLEKAAEFDAEDQAVWGKEYP